MYQDLQRLQEETANISLANFELLTKNFECRGRFTVAGEASAQSERLTVKRNRKPTSQILWRVATNLKRLRKAGGYSQVALAARTGIPSRYISSIEQERKNISLANLEALACGLECSEMDRLMPVAEGGQ